MKRFKKFLTERLAENTITMDGVDFDLGIHFSDRAKERNQLSKEDFTHLLHKIRSKIASLAPEGDFLFYSRKLKQGVIASWNAFKSRLKFITFLPRNKEFAKQGTEKVVVESLEYTVIYID